MKYSRNRTDIFRTHAMGLVSFLVPDKDCLCAHSVSTCHLVGFDGVPWQAGATLEGDMLRIMRDDHDSASLVIPWQIDDVGALALYTSSLRERELPYLLPLELARGTLCKLQYRRFLWSSIGFEASEGVDKKIRLATSLFIKSATSQKNPSESARLAARSLTLANQVVSEMSCEFRDFFQSAFPGQSATWFGFHLDSLTDVVPEVSGMAVASVSYRWREIEKNQDDYDWEAANHTVDQCDQRRIQIFGGGLLNLQPDSLPDWLYLWEGDFDAIESFVYRFISRVVKRYRNDVRAWCCSVATHADSELGLSEEQRLRLSAGAIESIRQVDQKTPILVNFEQPWGEYMAHDSLDLSPLQFAEMLARADLGVSGFALTIKLGNTASDTLCRNAFEFAGLIDRWAVIGLPLVIYFDLAPENGSADALSVINDAVAIFSTRKIVQGVIWSDRLKNAIPNA